MIRFEDNPGSACAVSMTSSSDTAMRHASHSSTRVGVIEPATFLRRLYPRDAAKSVSRDTGLSVRTVEKILSRQSAPSWTTTVALLLAYGPDFLAAVLPNAPAWLSRAVRAEHQARLEAEQERITRELEALGR